MLIEGIKGKNQSVSVNREIQCRQKNLQLNQGNKVILQLSASITKLSQSPVPCKILGSSSQHSQPQTCSRGNQKILKTSSAILSQTS